MDSPLHQFAVKTLLPLHIGGVDVSLTNSGVYMLLAVGVSLSLFWFATRRAYVVPTPFQSLIEMSYEIIAGMLEENIGAKGKRFIPFVLSVFVFILFGNLLGLLPYSFTFTSQLIVTFGLAAFIFLMVIGIGFYLHGWRFFKIFYPAGAPWFMAPLLIPIELISFLSRPVSLSVRLFVNMMAGHTMLKMFALFTLALGMWGVSTIILNSVLIAFEVLVAFLQAYVFTILTCLYLNDAVHVHS